MRERLASGALPLPEYFGQLLRLVYRLIFLLAAEDRNLLHPPTAPAGPRKLYSEGYSVGRLRDHAVRRAAWDRHRDRWEGLLIAFGALAGGEPLLGLPALGGMFEPRTIPDLEGARLANRDLMEAIYRLAWLREPSGLVPVNWRDMETEELGSVYEGLLELTPRLTTDGHGFAFAEAGEAKGNARKTSGSYYTPDSLVQALLDSALDPVLDRIEAEADDPAAVLLSVTVIDPACGSGHFLLAAARRIATRVARHRTGGVASAEDYRHALREVARASIHGVDRNPLAVELTKVALWIETVEPGKPLGFLDANIRCGDSLLGVFDLDALRLGIPDAAYKPLTGDNKETARYFGQRNKAERAGQGSLDFARGGGRLPAAAPLADEARALRAMPEDSPEEIATKRRRFAAGRADPRSWAVQIAADLYTAAFLVPKTGGVPANRNTVTIPTTAHVWDALAGRTVYGPLVGRAQDLAGQAHAFHWRLEFPDVMAAGGFDAVLGNPPWERIKLQEQEFFAAREPEIAEAPNAAARGRMIASLSRAEPGTRERALFEEFETAKRIAEASSVFARVPEADGGRFPLTGRGDVNTYALFAELFAGLAGQRGRAGVIVPTGIATDATTAPFFASLVEGNRLAQLTDFENRDAIFPAVHRSYKFSLLTIARDAAIAQFAFFLTDPNQLNEPERCFTLSAADIARINPNTKTAPVFRSRADAELTANIHAHVPVLIEESKGRAGNPWLMSIHTRIWHMAEDSEWFRNAAQLSIAGFVREGNDWTGEERYVPLYEAKMIHQFDHRWATYDGADSRDATLAEKADPGFEPTPRYWVPEREVADRLTAKGWTRQWLMGWRDICKKWTVGPPANIKWIDGAQVAIKHLLNTQNVEVFEISASYYPFAALVARELGIRADRVYSTFFSLDRYIMEPSEASRLMDLATEIVMLPDIPAIDRTSRSPSLGELSEQDLAALNRLEEIVWGEMAQELSCSSRMLAEVRAMGGFEKANAIRDASDRTQLNPTDTIYIGDSITDVEAFRALDEMGGITISFNGNQYAVNNAALCVWSDTSLVSAVIAGVFQESGKAGLYEFARTKDSSLVPKELSDIYARLSGRNWGIALRSEENRDVLIRESDTYRRRTRAAAAAAGS